MPRKSLRFSFHNSAGAPKFHIPFHSLAQLQDGTAIPDETDVEFVFHNTGGSPSFIISNEDDHIQVSESSDSEDDVLLTSMEGPVDESSRVPSVAREESVEESSEESDSDKMSLRPVLEDAQISNEAVTGQKRQRAGESDRRVEKTPKRIRNDFADIFTEEQISWVAQETKGLDISEIRKPATWSNIEYRMIKEAQVRQNAKCCQPLDAMLIFTIWLELKCKEWERSAPTPQDSRISTSQMECLEEKNDQITTRLGAKTVDWHAILFAKGRTSSLEAFRLYSGWRKRMWRFQGAANSTSTFYSSTFTRISGGQRDASEMGKISSPIEAFPAQHSADLDHKPVLDNEKYWVITRTMDLKAGQIKLRETWRNLECEMLSAAQELAGSTPFRPLDAVLIFTIWLDAKFTEWTSSSTYSVPPEGLVSDEEASWLRRHTDSITTRFGMKVVDWHALLRKMKGEACQRNSRPQFRSPSWEPVNVYFAWRKGMWSFSREGDEKPTFYSHNFQSKGLLTRP